MNSDVNEYVVILEPAQEGGFNVSVPDLPGCLTQGDTREEALAMVKEAIELMIESMVARGLAVPPPTATSETVRISA